MTKGETMNFCSAKKQTLQSFVMKKAHRKFLQSEKVDTTNFVVPRSGDYKLLYG